MGSTGEPDRKRQLSSSFVPGAAAVAPAKRPALPPCSDDKKLDFAVLKYRNQKLLEQLEVHKFEYHVLEGKFDDLTQRQKAHNEILELVNKSWEHLVRDLEVTSVCKSESQNSACSTGHSNVSTDGACISQDTDFLRRLVETGATESSGCHLENLVPPVQSSTADVLQNVMLSSNDSWHANKFSLALFSALHKNEFSRQLRITANELSLELNDAIQALSDLHLKHRQLTQNYHNQRYSNARSKAEQKHLKEELTSTVAELEEMNYKLAIPKAQRDTTHGTPILFPTLGNKSTPGRPADNVRDKQKELQDLEASHKEFTDLISKRLAEIKRRHEVRIEIVNKLDTFQIFMEGIKVKQAQDALYFEVRTLHRNLQQANSMMDLYDDKIAHLEDKLKVWSEQVGRLAEDGWRHSVSLGNAQRKLVDVQGEAQQLRQSTDQRQAKVGRSRLEVAELLIESEKERFSKRRIEDDLELMSRKASSLKSKDRGISSVGQASPGGQGV